MSAELRIFSYLPNPRIAKATIVARLTGVELDLRGAAPGELSNWLWDFDARSLSAEDQIRHEHLVRRAKTGFTSRLFKTEAFLAAQPFGTVPAAFSADGEVGIFESNSIMRAVARLREGQHGLYGRDALGASRIDSFLDAGLLFARDVQVYVLAMRGGAIPPHVHAGVTQAFTSYLAGVERALSTGHGFLAGKELTLADICFVTEMALLHNEFTHREMLASNSFEALLTDASRAEFPLAFAHFDRLCANEAFAPDLGPYLKALVPA